MSRVQLAEITSLTFYKDALTTARRTEPISQLNCVGKACQLYTPDVVRCVNIGGEGTEVDWKCEADLPEALRFGRVEVSCEGWSRPGDPFVLKGSCALEYRLNHIPDALRRPEHHHVPSKFSSWFQGLDLISFIFGIAWIAVLCIIIFSFLKSCFQSRQAGNTRRPGSGPSRPTRGTGWFPGYRPDDRHDDAPPPYSKHPAQSQANADPGWRPNFWTGAALGGLGAYLIGNNARRRETPTTTSYDWERERQARMPRVSPIANPGYASQRRSFFSSEDRGDGSSNLGPMRRSTGLGGSSVR
ncbi:hypothetical protein PHLGIDRAFT_172240 [Phlebiopsis gigantea 11061_1 CR5-6]|uniref:Store-operated calcium entry-associated regulatory factor n=1 Tax=Phlebiopsis gigantea (strain 11061_1 CR5-6) TaxID=745531 RepID=A0A0C3SCJ9_PHLG1|nr:hypothetical protein PHLGIDRAFT_172240 [Phlebiopsis gigantea 11061_1 CR5-6]